MKRLAYLYTTEKSVYRKGKWLHEPDTDGCLFSLGRRKTSLHKEDLPPWYIPGLYDNLGGYLSAKDILYLVYVPDKAYVHVYHEEFLLVSHALPIIPSPGTIGWYTGYDAVISDRNTMDSFLDAVEQYSSYDTTSIRKAMQIWRQWIEAHPSAALPRKPQNSE